MLFPTLALIFIFFLVYNNFVSNTDTQKSRANTRVYPNIKLIHNNTATTVVYTIEYIGILLQVTTGTCDYSRVTGSFWSAQYYLGVDPLSNLHSTMSNSHRPINKIDAHKHSVRSPSIPRQPKPHWRHGEPTFAPTVCLQSASIDIFLHKSNCTVWLLITTLLS